MSGWRALGLVLLSMLPSGFVGAEESQSGRAEPELLVFVGKLLQVRELDYDCGERCWNFDSGFSLTYRVLEDLQGDVGAQEITFDFFGHYGIEGFAHYDKALVFVYRTAHGYVMARYLAFPVERTTDGEWAYCGDPYPADTHATQRMTRRARFVEPVAFSEVTRALREGTASDYVVGKMKSGRVRCSGAVSANQLIVVFKPGAEPGYWRTYQFE